MTNNAIIITENTTYTMYTTHNMDSTMDISHAWKLLSIKCCHFLQLENPTSVPTVGGATSSVALWRNTRRGATTISSVWGCRTASIQVSVCFSPPPTLVDLLCTVVYSGLSGSNVNEPTMLQLQYSQQVRRTFYDIYLHNKCCISISKASIMYWTRAFGGFCWLISSYSEGEKHFIQ